MFKTIKSTFRQKNPLVPCGFFCNITGVFKTNNIYMKNRFTRLAVLAFFLVASYSLSAQNSFWADVTESNINADNGTRLIVPAKFRSLMLDSAKLLNYLDQAPMEFTSEAKSNPLILSIPMPDGSFSRFRIVKSPMMAAGLSAQFPYFRAFGGQGVDDPYATIKIDWNALGFHAQVFSPNTGATYIDPYAQRNLLYYISYNKTDLAPKPFYEESIPSNSELRTAGRTTGGPCTGGTLRKYRLAVACTGEYAVAATGSTTPTVAQVLSAIMTTVNRVDGVYEKEVAIRFVLVDSNQKLIYLNGGTDPFNNTNASTLIGQSQTVITNSIGAPNYDIGHTVSTGGGGLAGLGVVCNNTQKARGITGSPQPTGDPYDIDYVAHEIGHQFGGNHTFNASTGSCQNNGSKSANAEPGSGITIMAYAGICQATNNLAANSIPYFHALSTDEIVTFSTLGGGNTCPDKTNTANTPPVVITGGNYNIPLNTPFFLTGTATDADNDPLTYSWEQVNKGAAFSNWNAPTGPQAPIFRSFPPVTSGTRFFPKLSDQINNVTTIGELLPTYARPLNFRLTARDNKANGGGVCYEEMAVNVIAGVGPFIVTQPNTTLNWQVGTFQNVTWNVASTNAAPVNVKLVDIELSTDGGLTFPIVLKKNVLNDGEQEITVPNNLTSTARVRVKSVGNVFYDISNSNFTIQQPTQSTYVVDNPDAVTSCSSTNASAVLRTNSLNGYSTPITLTSSGNPAGSTVVFSSNTINPGDSVIVSLQSTGLAAGTYTVNVTATSGATVFNRTLKFIVGAPTVTTVSVSPADRTAGLTLTPTFTWQAATGNPEYLLEISKFSDFSFIAQSVSNLVATSHTLAIPLEENTEYFWRVSAMNACGGGTPSAANLIKTAQINCTSASTATPLTIPLAGTVTSSLAVTTGGTIADVDVVGMNMQHAYIEDMTATLISPANTRVTLFSAVCGDQSGTWEFNFDDAAASGITCPISSSPGVVTKPSIPLSTFNGQNSVGTWRLELVDAFSPDGGLLSGWGLRICTYATTPFPVNWLTFSGRKGENNSVQLNWSTANEVDNVYYEIQRGNNGVEFSAIGRLNAGTLPGTVQQYIFNDAKPAAGANYYRLKQLTKMVSLPTLQL
jgi:subtilisin-like proprotein convertase family protein